MELCSGRVLKPEAKGEPALNKVRVDTTRDRIFEQFEELEKFFIFIFRMLDESLSNIFESILINF